MAQADSSSPIASFNTTMTTVANAACSPMKSPGDEVRESAIGAGVVVGRSAQHARYDRRQCRNRSREANGRQVGGRQSGAVGKKLSDIDLRSDSRPKHTEGLQIADKEGARRKRKLRPRTTRSTQQRGEADHNGRAHRGGGGQQDEVPARFGPRGPSFGNACPQRKAAGKRTQRSAALQRAQHRCDAVRRNETQPLDATVDAGINPFHPTHRRNEGPRKILAKRSASGGVAVWQVWLGGGHLMWGTHSVRGKYRCAERSASPPDIPPVVDLCFYKRTPHVTHDIRRSV